MFPSIIPQFLTPKMMFLYCFAVWIIWNYVSESFSVVLSSFILFKIEGLCLNKAWSYPEFYSSWRETRGKDLTVRPEEIQHGTCLLIIRSLGKSRSHIISKLDLFSRFDRSFKLLSFSQFSGDPIPIKESLSNC